MFRTYQSQVPLQLLCLECIKAKSPYIVHCVADDEDEGKQHQNKCVNKHNAIDWVSRHTDWVNKGHPYCTDIHK